MTWLQRIGWRPGIPREDHFQDVSIAGRISIGANASFLNPAGLSLDNIFAGKLNEIRVVTSETFPSLSDAVADLPDGGSIFLLTGTNTVSSNLTVPSNISLIFPWGAILSPDSGITLTISGDIQAGLYQIFSGDGSIVFDPVKSIVYPAWWGAVHDGSTDDSTALQAAIDSVGDTTATRRGGTTVDISGPTAIASTVTVRRKSIIIQGHGWGDDTASSPESGYIKWTGTRTSFTIDSAPTGADRTSNVVTITTTAAHGFSVRSLVTVAGVTDTSFNGTFLIASVPTTTTFTYDQIDSNGTSGGGTVNVGTPIIEFRDALGGAGVRDCVFIGSTTNPPEAAISLYETDDSVPNSRLYFENIEIGIPGGGKQFDTGVRVHGDVNTNNAENLFDSLSIRGCVDAGVRVGGTQNVYHRFNNLNVANCAFGIWNAGEISGSSWFFGNNSVDIFSPNNDEFGNSVGAAFFVHYLNSESAGRLAELAGSGVLDITGGSFQLTSSTNNDGKVIIAEGTDWNAVTLRNFDFPQASAPPTNPFLSIRTLAGQAFAKTIVLDGIRAWANMTGGTPSGSGLDVEAHGTTDRRYIYLRVIDNVAGSGVTKVSRQRIVGFAGTQDWDPNRYEPEGPSFTFRKAATFTDTDTTPSVADGNWFTVTNTSGTTITTFDNGVDGKVIHLRFTNGNTTLADGSTLNLLSGANVTPVADDILSFVFNGTNWYEIPLRSTLPLNILTTVGKITAGAEVEIDGDLNHDGSNIGFFGVTPADRPGTTEDIKDALTTLGLLQGTSATPLNLDAGTLTCGEVNPTGNLNHDGSNVGFYGTTPAAQASASANLTDNSGGTADDTIADITEANNAGSADRVPTENAIADLAAKVNDILTAIRDIGIIAT